MPNYAAQAAIKCKEPLFAQFLYQCEHYAGRTPESPEQALRNLAKVESRSEFNHPDSYAKWFDVLKLFGKWRQGFGNDADGDPTPPFLMGQRAWERGCELEDNPYQRDEGPNIDRPHDLWAQGWKTRKWRDEHDKKGRR